MRERERKKKEKYVPSVQNRKRGKHERRREGRREGEKERGICYWQGEGVAVTKRMGWQSCGTSRPTHAGDQRVHPDHTHTHTHKTTTYQETYFGNPPEIFPL
jgi:hypothetical protein